MKSSRIDNPYYKNKKVETIKHESEILRIYAPRIAFNAIRIRMNMGYSHKDMANAIDVYYSVIQRLESGISKQDKQLEPRLLTLLKISEACKISVIEFFKPIPNKE